MTVKNAIKILEYHNKWRVGKVDDPIYTPREITEAMKTIIRYTKKKYNEKNKH